MIYRLPFDDIVTGAVADTFKTLAAILVADTAGHRVRLRNLIVGFAQDTPPDVPVALKIGRIADASAGTAGTAGNTVSTANMPKVDPGSIACLMTGPRAYSVEPTAYETEPLWSDDLNAHNGIIMPWPDPDERPRATQDMLIALLAAPRTAVAVAVSGTLEFEMY